MADGDNTGAPSHAAGRRIEGSVDLSVGDVSCAGDLWVGGNVLDGREVRAPGSIHVRGVIQASLVVAAGDLCADGGISGRDRGCCRAGGELHARYITNATAESASDMTVVAEVLNTRIICGGQFRAEHGSLVASHLSVVREIHCKSVGNPAGVKTVLEAGVDAVLEREARAAVIEIESNFARSTRIRQAVSPLMRNQKSLTAEQREKATELLFEADELERQGIRLQEEIRRRYHALAARARAEVRVAHALHPGTVVRLGDLEACIETAFTGPLRLLARSIGPDRWIAVVDDAGGEVDLPAHAVEESSVELLRGLLHKSAQKKPAVSSSAA